jgi:hypothetical protein
MLSISHVTTAAFIASKVSNPILAVPLIFASHYLEDWIPHWDVGTGLSNGKRKKRDAIILEIGELMLSAIIVYVFWPGAHGQDVTWIYIGGLIGLVPDFLEAPRNFLKYEPSWLKPINEFHGQFHHSIPNMFWGLLPQVILLVVIFLLK